MKNVTTLLAILLVVMGSAAAQWSYFDDSEWLGQVGDMIETSDGGFATCSWTTTTPTVLVNKLNASGSIEWSVTVDHPGFNDYAQSIMETADGGFIVAGYENYWSRPFAAKLDAEGSLQWTNFSWADTMASGFSGGRGTLLPDGNLALIGSAALGSTLTIHLIDGTDGSLISTSVEDSIDGAIMIFTSINDVATTDDGGFILTGSTFNMAFEQVYFLAKYNAVAEMEWSDIYATSGEATAMGIDVTADGSYLVTGTNDLSVFILVSETFLAKHAADGTLEWSEYYTTGIDFPSGMDVAERTDGSIVMVETGGELLFPNITEECNILYINSDGTLNDQVRIGEIGVVYMTRLKATSDGGFIVAGLVGNDSITMETNYTALIKSSAGGSLPDCMFNCVWPGDADNDGMAGPDDILALGLAYGSTGPARVDMSIDWTAHAADDWTDTLPDGTNLKYADCDGNGMVNGDDTLAVVLNYGYEHPVFSLKSAAGDIPLFIGIPEIVLTPGSYAFPVNLGDAINFPEAIYGIRFSITYDGNDLDLSSVNFQFGDNWFGIADEEIRFRRNHSDAQKLDVALVRNDQNNTTGYGEIGELSFVVIDNIAGKAMSETILFQISDVRAIDVVMNEIAVNGEGAEVTSESTDIDNTMLEGIQVYPNPVADGMLYLSWPPANQPERIQLLDLTGRVLLAKDNMVSGIFDITPIPAGTYLLEVIGADKRQVLSIIVQ